MFRRVMYWIISCTWGALMTFIGAVVAIVLCCKRVKPERLGPCVFFRIGTGWGGLNLGPFSIISKDSSYETVLHEAGHSIQNLMWGPFFPFVIVIPSMLRCCVRKFNQDERLKFAMSVCLMLICSMDMLLTVAALASGKVFIWTLLFTWSTYIAFLCAWLCFIEIPKYKYGLTPYKSIWFEKQAIYFGYKYFQ